MPFYEYQCQACRSHHEVLQKISDPPLKKCPTCQKSALTKLISAPVFRLKGSGWYETDFKSDQEKKRNLVGSEDTAPAADTPSTAKSSDKSTQDSAKASESKVSAPAAKTPKAPAKKPAAKTSAKSAKAKQSVKKPAAKRR